MATSPKKAKNPQPRCSHGTILTIFGEAPPFNLAPLLSILGFLGTGRRKAKKEEGGGGYLAFRPILAGGQEGQEAGKRGAPLGGASDNAPRLRLLAPYSPAAKKAK